MNRRRLRAAAAIAALALVGTMATACSGVPSSSKPQVIGPRLGDDTLGPQPTDTPRPHAEPRDLVQEFLKANLSEPLDPRGPREFLTPDEQRKWSDKTVTVLAGSISGAQVDLAQTGNPHAVSVTVHGTQIGSIGPDGAYSPVPPASGGKGAQWSYAYGLDPVNSEFRISDAPDGLVVYAQEFAQAYRPVRLYYLDQSETRLVPDVRYTALESSSPAAATWELNQLMAEPPADLGNAVKTEVPNQPQGHPSVSINGLQIRVEMPGSARLDGDSKIRMAAQLLATLGSQSPKMALTITDGGTPVSIGNFQDSFTRADFARLPSPTAPEPQLHFFDQAPDSPGQWPLFYLDAQDRLVTDDGQPVSGPLGTAGRYQPNSIAITGGRADPDYYVAACLGSGNQQTLWLGRTATGLTTKATVPRGPLTRPSWLASHQEVWVASGSTVYNVQPSGRAQVVPTTLPSASRITALRLSPEGSRIAMIVGNQSGQSQLWIGSIVRNDPSDGSTSARIGNMEAITPSSYHLTDVAWSDDIVLWVVGSGPEGGHVWSVYADGAVLKDQGLTGLPEPQRLDSITAGVGVLPWSSAGGYVYQENPDTQSWEGPGRRTTHGTDPVYQEGYID